MVLRSEVDELKLVLAGMKPCFEILAHEHRILELSPATGETFSIAAHPTDLVSTIKERIQGMPAPRGMRSSEQGLVLRGAVELEDGQSLGDYSDVTVESRLPVWLIRRNRLALVRVERRDEGSVIDVKVDVDWTVSLLAERIRTQSGRNLIEWIVFRGELLNADQTLRSAGISEGSTLFLCPRMQVFLRGLAVPHIALEVHQDMLVEGLKKLIAIKTGAPIDEQILSWAGHPLHNARILRDSSIPKDGILSLCVCLRL
jgi:hypothetical protein